MISNTIRTLFDKLKHPPGNRLPDVRRVNIWPRIIASGTSMPEEFKDVFNAINFRDHSAFPYIVYIPNYHWEMGERGFQFVNLKSILIALETDRISIFKKLESKIIPAILKFSDICYIERGCILLFSWIKICGNDGKSLTSIEFNTTAERIFDPIVEKLRLYYGNSVEPRGDISQEQQVYEKGISIKIWSYAHDIKKSFLPDQGIVGTVYQPKIFRNNLKETDNPLSCAHFIILTNKELIILKEMEEYGASWKYIPLTRVKNISFKESGQPQVIFQGQKIFVLSVSLTSKEKIFILFSQDNKYHVEALIKKYYRLSN